MKFRDFTYCLYTKETNEKFKNHCKKNGLRIWRELEKAMKMYLEKIDSKSVSREVIKSEDNN